MRPEYAASPGTANTGAGTGIGAGVDVDAEEEVPSDIWHAVHAACHRWGFENADARLIKHRENWIFRVSFQGRDYALRIHRPGYQSLAGVQCEMDILRALAESGFPSVVPCASAGDDSGGSNPVGSGDTGDSSSSGRSGRLVETILVGGQSYIVDVQEWLYEAAQLGTTEAMFLGTDVPDLASFERLGALTATMHGVLARDVEHGGIDASSRGKWDVEGLAGPDFLWGDPRGLVDDVADASLIETALSGIRSRLRQLGYGEQGYGLIHGDLTMENVLLLNGEFMIIDFDDAGSGWYLFDLATPLAFMISSAQFPRYEAAVLDGYESVRAISAQERAAWPSILLARVLTYLSWAAGRRGEETAEFLHDTYMPCALEMTRKYVVSMTANQ